MLLQSFLKISFIKTTYNKRFLRLQDNYYNSLRRFTLKLIENSDPKLTLSDIFMLKQIDNPFSFLVLPGINKIFMRISKFLSL